MATFEYRAVIVNHRASELSITDGGPPESIDGAYFSPLGVFNQLGSEGWKHTGSVHEQLEGVGAFTMHYFSREG